MDFDELEGLKKKRHKIRGDQGRPATNPSMVKLVSFLRKQGISNLWELCVEKLTTFQSKTRVYIGL